MLEMYFKDRQMIIEVHSFANALGPTSHLHKVKQTQHHPENSQVTLSAPVLSGAVKARWQEELHRQASEWLFIDWGCCKWLWCWWLWMDEEMNSSEALDVCYFSIFFSYQTTVLMRQEQRVIIYPLTRYLVCQITSMKKKSNLAFISIHLTIIISHCCMKCTSLMKFNICYVNEQSMKQDKSI